MTTPFDDRLERALANLDPEIARAVRAVRQASDPAGFAAAERWVHRVVDEGADALVADALRARLHDLDHVTDARQAAEARAKTEGHTLRLNGMRFTDVRLLGGTTIRVRVLQVRRSGWPPLPPSFPALERLGIFAGTSPALRHVVAHEVSAATSLVEAQRSLESRGIHLDRRTLTRLLARETEAPLPDLDLPVRQSAPVPVTAADAAPLPPPPAPDRVVSPLLEGVEPDDFDIPIDLEPEVARWVDFFAEGGGRPSFQRWLDRSAGFRSRIHTKLEESGVPRGLLYLSMIESGFEPRAYSHAHAAGQWQFIASTATAYGLSIDDWVDDRYDPDRSLTAAIAYLRDLYGQFQDWRLAWAAYNTGPRRVKRALGESDSPTWWAIARGKWLAQETRDYVPKIMAAAIVGHDPERHDFVPPGAPPPPPDIVSCEGPLDIRRIATALGLDTDTLLALNPSLLRAATPPGTQGLRVPHGQGDALAALLDGARLPMARHSVRAGEQLDAIATAHRVPVAALRDVNPALPDPPAPGSIVLVPRLPPLLPRTRAHKWTVHRVKPGESVSSIASRYGTSAEALATLNGMTDPDQVEANQSLWIVGSHTASSRRRRARRNPDPSSFTSYVARRGDTLPRIARSFGVTVQELVDWNHLPGIRVVPGQRLAIRVPRANGPQNP
ncbi:MAG: LysM peptidoglycan-binding domain-containing protein [Myxococcota bacterium]